MSHNAGGGGGFKLPVQPLVNPLNEHDLNGLRALEQQIAIAKDMVARAAGLVHGIEERIERCAMHENVHATIMERYFPEHLPITSE
jgi:hypothetical protein